MNNTQSKEKIVKKQKLRNNEYYNIQNTFDLLYKQSENNCKFKNLYDYIIEPNNILLAYRNIKTNKGSDTKGCDKENIDNYKHLNSEDIVRIVKEKLANYKPRKVRRVMIPKPNGKLRPLGIPSFIDRLIQQCILQVLEPICEAKFYAHSYGFRPNRSTKHAYARATTLVNQGHNYYSVDVDISGFFDNVNHGKLLKQMWHLGIRDKRLLTIISKILKAEIDGEGIPTKGTPQGGILSPLLSNIVLNELDWWIANQWEFVKSERQYSNNGKKFRALKNTNLKEIWIVRYADDFKILCKTKCTANKIYHATKQWLKERLGLEVSDEKSRITNLKKNFSEFLGFRFKLKRKRNKWVVRSRLTEKSFKNVKDKLRKQVVKMQKSAKPFEVRKYNSMVLGVQNYYKTATDVIIDFGKLNYIVERKIYNRIGRFIKYKAPKTEAYANLYKGCGFKTKEYCGVLLFPLGYVQHSSAMNFTQQLCDYTEQGRILIHKQLYGVDNLLNYLLKNSVKYKSVEYADNMMSKICAQKGKCNVTGNNLFPETMECHHITPRSLGGSDEYKNLVWLNRDVHKLIHTTTTESIQKYMKRLNPNKSQLNKINKFRLTVGNCSL